MYINFRREKLPLPFKNLIVEIGFGSGDFLVNLAKDNPDKIFFGIEISDISIRKLIQKIKRENIKNIFFTKIDAFFGFQILFEDKSISKIYINYPDPWFKKRHHKRRITRRDSLLLFAKKLEDEGTIIIRTDYFDFVEYTKEQSEGIFHFFFKELHVSDPLTKYERKWISQGRKIYEIVLKKMKDTPPPNIRLIQIAEEETKMFLEKKKSLEEICDILREIRQKEFRIGEGIVFKVFDFYRSEKKVVVESLLSENGFVQMFFIIIAERENNYIIDVSNFSEVLRTKGLLKTLRFFASFISKK